LPGCFDVSSPIFKTSGPSTHENERSLACLSLSSAKGLFLNRWKIRFNLIKFGRNLLPALSRRNVSLVVRS
jgi:hypothetical protein